MIKRFCDIPKCKEDAYRLEVDVCYGYLISTEPHNEPKIKHKPFEKPDVRKYDLCKKHFTAWCSATYTKFFKVVRE